MVSTKQPYLIWDLKSAETVSIDVNWSIAPITVGTPHSLITVFPSVPFFSLIWKVPAFWMGADKFTLIIWVSPFALQIPEAPAMEIG